MTDAKGNNPLNSLNDFIGLEVVEAKGNPLENARDFIKSSSIVTTEPDTTVDNFGPHVDSCDALMSEGKKDAVMSLGAILSTNYSAAERDAMLAKEWLEVPFIHTKVDEENPTSLSNPSPTGDRAHMFKVHRESILKQINAGPLTPIPTGMFPTDFKNAKLADLCVKTDPGLTERLMLNRTTSTISSPGLSAGFLKELVIMDTEVSIHDQMESINKTTKGLRGMNNPMKSFGENECRPNALENYLKEMALKRKQRKELLLQDKNLEAKLEDTDLEVMLSDTMELYDNTSSGEWQQGESSHETVSVQEGRAPYHIANFRHANDASFVDYAHNCVPVIVRALHESLDKIKELQKQLEEKK